MFVLRLGMARRGDKSSGGNSLKRSGAGRSVGILRLALARFSCSGGVQDDNRQTVYPNSVIIPEKTTMSIQTARKRLAEQIRAAIQNDDSRSPSNLEELDLLAEQWRTTPEAGDDRLLDNAYHSFLHFLTDRDIRSRDSKYAESQITAMRQLIEKLERPPSIG